MSDDSGATLPPETTAEQLAALAAERPDLWDAIWHHPNSYDGLRQWMSEQYGGQQPVQPDTVQPQPYAAELAPQQKRRGFAIIASIVAVALVLAGTGTALALSGVFDRFFGDRAPGAGTAVEQGSLSFAAGIERMWTADSNDHATPRVGELGQDFSYLRSAFSRASIAMFQADYPVATSSAVVFNARGEDSVLVMLDADSGDTILEYDLDGLAATCAADSYAKSEVFYCVTAHDQQSRSTLLRIDTEGKVDERRFDLALHRVAVGKDRIVLAGDSGAVVALDRSMGELWRRDGLPNGGYAGVDLGGDRSLIRGYNGWTLLGADGSTLATAEVLGPYENGNGECDARLTESGKLFVTNDDACVDNEAGITWWGFGENLLHKHFFSSGGHDYVLSQNENGAELLRFPESDDGRLETVLETELTGEVVGVTAGERPLLVISGGGTAASFAPSDGEEVARWNVDAPQRGWVTDQAARILDHLLLDEAGTALLGGTAYDARTGERLWSLDAGDQTIAGWASPAGLLVLGGGCPECSTAGGAYTSSTLTLYAPAGSGGTPVGGAAEQSGTTTVEAPEFIPACPGSTILLAWMELEDGWIVVCGVGVDQPSYLAYHPNADRSGSARYSLGASKPESELARSSVKWDATQQRYIAAMADGSKLTLDYTTGTATLRDGETNSTVREQHRFVRYVFVPLGTEVRGESDSAGRTGAFDVTTPEATAEDQIRYMIEVLERSYEGRALVKTALPKLQNCTAGAGGYGDSVEAMKAVRDNRARLLAALDAMPVDKIPEGKQLLADLTEAISNSHQANIEYVAWAEAANASGCAALSARGNTLAEASQPPKERFAERWNRAVAPAYGVRTFDASYI